MAKRSYTPGNFPARLRELRSKAGLSLEALAKASGVPDRSISRFESGERYPRWDTVLALAEFFGISMEQMAKPAGNGPVRKSGRPKKVTA